MERRCHAVLDAAHTGGIRYFDAARSYGLAETFLANWLTTRIPAESLFIASKWGYQYVGDWKMDAMVHETKDLSFEALVRQYEETRAILGDRLNLYQIHSATLESGVLDDVRVIGELGKLRATGIEIGLTTTGPAQADVIRRALSVHVDGVALFQSVQSTWNLLETSAGPALADAHARGLRVVVKEALANGRLTGREPGLMSNWACDAGTTPDAFALAAALQQPWADIVLSGAVTVDQLRSNVKALQIPAITTWPSIAETPASYWTSRSRRAWG